MSRKFAQMVSKWLPCSLLQWPYCLRRCSYCNFNKYISRENNDHIMRECLQRETETLLQLSQVSWYGDSLDLPHAIIQHPLQLSPTLHFHFSTQHYLSIFWGWDSEPGSPLDHWCSARKCYQAGKSLRQGRGHARGQPYSCGNDKVRGLLPCWGEPFLHWGPGEYIICNTDHSRLDCELCGRALSISHFRSVSLCRMRIWKFWEETTVLIRLRKPSKRPGGCAPGGCRWMSCSDGPNRALNPGRMSCLSCCGCAMTTCLCTSWPWSEAPSCSNRCWAEKWPSPLKMWQQRCTSVPGGLSTSTAFSSTRCLTLQDM